MANVLYPVHVGQYKILVDMGDGSHAERVSIGDFRPATPTDKSGTITSGGAAQTIAAANITRRGFWIQNQSVGDLWLNTEGTAAATQPSLRIPAGSYYESPILGAPAGAISLFGATTGQEFAAREW